MVGALSICLFGAIFLLPAARALEPVSSPAVRTAQGIAEGGDARALERSYDGRGESSGSTFEARGGLFGLGVLVGLGGFWGGSWDWRERRSNYYWPPPLPPPPAAAPAAAATGGGGGSDSGAMKFGLVGALGGALAGALIGFAVGGPIGAVMGAVAGALFGFMAGAFLGGRGG